MGRTHRRHRARTSRRSPLRPRDPDSHPLRRAGLFHQLTNRLSEQHRNQTFNGLLRNGLISFSPGPDPAAAQRRPALAHRRASPSRVRRPCLAVVAVLSVVSAALPSSFSEAVGARFSAGAAGYPKVTAPDGGTLRMTPSTARLARVWLWCSMIWSRLSSPFSEVVWPSATRSTS